MISIEIIRVAFVLAAMNKLEVCAADVSTSFLYGKTREKLYVIVGKEFGEHAGKRILIDKRLYGLQSSAARFNEKLASTLRQMKFKTCKADHTKNWSGQFEKNNWGIFWFFSLIKTKSSLWASNEKNIAISFL